MMSRRNSAAVFAAVLFLCLIAVGSVPLPTRSPAVASSTKLSLIHWEGFIERLPDKAGPALQDPMPEPGPRPLPRPIVARPPFSLRPLPDAKPMPGPRPEPAYKNKAPKLAALPAMREASSYVRRTLPAAECTGACNLPEMGQTYRGWGTYYDTPPMPPNTHVHCHLPNMGEGLFGWHGVHRTVAMNAVQYVGSMSCGTCIEVWGHGRLCPGGVEGPDCGMGPERYAINQTRILAVVTDELWERGRGDIDFGVYGDGIYPVKWRPYPCPWAKSMARITLHSGSNKNYIKIQFRYLDSGMRYVTNEGSGETSGDRFHDNHFVFQAGGLAGIQGWKNGKLRFRAVSNIGTHYCGEIDRHFRAAPFEYGAWAC